METHNVFKCAKIANIKASALLCVSDNTIINKSLYSGRTAEENEYRHRVRYDIIPKIIINLFEELYKENQM